jgi:hypothetical protein
MLQSVVELQCVRVYHDRSHYTVAALHFGNFHQAKSPKPPQNSSPEINTFHGRLHLSTLKD